MIYTVTLNPSLDYVVSDGNFRIGETNRSENEKILPGGKGLNVSLLLKSLHEDSCAVTVTAGFTGKELLRLLEEQGIRADVLQLSEGMTRINVKIRGEEVTELNGSGICLSEEDQEAILSRFEKLTQKDMLVVSGSLPKGVKTDFYRQIAEHAGESRVIVDASKEALLEALKAKPFLVKPNRAELSEALGRMIVSEKEILNGAIELQSMGARNVLVSLGKDGALLLTENGEVFRKRAPKLPEAYHIINQVAAGDSMLAGFLYAYEKTGDYETALDFSQACGAASACSEGVAEKETIDAFGLYVINRT